MVDKEGIRVGKQPRAPERTGALFVRLMSCNNWAGTVMAVGPSAATTLHKAEDSPRRAYINEHSSRLRTARHGWLHYGAQERAHRSAIADREKRT